MTKKPELRPPSPAEMGKLSLERMADLTRRVVAVKKSELPKGTPKKRKRP